MITKQYVKILLQEWLIQIPTSKVWFLEIHEHACSHGLVQAISWFSSLSISRKKDSDVHYRVKISNTNNLNLVLYGLMNGEYLTSELYAMHYVFPRVWSNLCDLENIFKNWHRKGIIMQQLSNCVLFLDNWFGFCEAFCNVENEQAYKAREQGCRGPALGQFLFCKYLSCNYETSRNHRLVELRYVSHCNIEYTTVLFNLLLFLSPSNSNSYAFEYWACYCYNKLEMHQQHSIFQVLD